MPGLDSNVDGLSGYTNTTKYYEMKSLGQRVRVKRPKKHIHCNWP